MNRMLAASLPVLLALGACATTQGPPAAGPALAAIGNCQSQAKMGTCPKTQVININLVKAGGSTATPECVTAQPGDTVTLNITPVPKNSGGAITVPTDAVNGWLVSSNADAAAKHKILITVPADAAAGPYEYLVLSEEGVCLDPRFIIER